MSVAPSASREVEGAIRKAITVAVSGSEGSARALDRRLKHQARPRLLCIDEVGYLSYDNRNTDLLFEVVSRRYQQRSLVLTTDLAFSEWPTIFPSATSATALIDRVIHHADVIAVEGDRFRRREAEAAARSRRGTRSR